jgi:uncharacterized protein
VLRGFARLSPEQRREAAKVGARALVAKGLNHQWSSQEAKEAGSKGGRATWRKWKISRRGKELRVPEEV